MIKEFAVDPELYRTQYEWQILFQHFGIHTGRLISKFPQNWVKEAYKSLKKNYDNKKIKEIERKRLEERLKYLEGYLIDLSRPYDNNLDWFQNAIKEHIRTAFSAIISKSNPENQPHILKLENLDNENEYWNTPRQIIVNRNFEDISKLLRNLFKVSSEVILVDRHFHPTKEKYRRALVKLVKEIFSIGPNYIKLEYHILADPLETKTQFFNSCNHYIKEFLPDNKSIKFVRWNSMNANDANAGGNIFHARLILTDVGGVNIEWGLDEGNRDDKTTITLLEPQTYSFFWKFHHRVDVIQDEILVEGGQ